MFGGVDFLIVRIESPSSSEIPDNVERSEYAFSTEDARFLSEEVDSRIVSVSDPEELIVDIVRSEAALDSPSDEGAKPISCLCAPQWMSGIDVSLNTISSSLSRTSRAGGRIIGALLSMLRTSSTMWGMARNASSSCSKDVFSSDSSQLSTLSRLAWNEESVLEFFPPVVIFCFEVLYFTKSWGFFFSMNVMISTKTQPKEKISAFSVSCTRERGLGVGFVRLNPKLKPEKSPVGAFVSFWRCELLLFEDPDELLLMIDACFVIGDSGGGSTELGSNAEGSMWVSGAL
jgi:hypothetical protein